MPPQDPPTIDDLLARYLLLLDQYTTLRDTLSAHTRALHVSLTRANFVGSGHSTGWRPYGQDTYDMRMRASRRLKVRPVSDSEQDAVSGEPVFEIVSEDGEKLPKAPSPVEEGAEDADAAEDAAETDADRNGETKDDTNEETDADGNDETQDDTAEAAKKPVSNDPLRWFGILTPLPLREAQKEGVHLVEAVIPQLASIDVQMAGIELAIRRARKKRAKAEVAARKLEVAGEEGTGLTV